MRDDPVKRFADKIALRTALLIEAGVLVDTREQSPTKDGGRAARPGPGDPESGKG